MLKLKSIYKSYISSKKNRVDALTDINISFETKGLIFVLGASGSGKSTLLNLIGGLDTPTSGDIFINNEKIFSNNSSLELYRNNYISFIFQDFNLLSNLTVYENISMVYGENNPESVREKVQNILTKVNLSGYEERYPNELSGGEIQRVAIARALSNDSAIILADEPTGNLNKENGKNICEILKKISSNKLVIVVSHNEDLANEFADRIIKLEDGKIIDDVIVNEIKNDKTEFIPNSQIISKKNILKLSLKNLFDKKMRFIISMVSIILAFSVLSLSLVISGFERPHVDAKNIINNNVNKYLISSNQDHSWMYNSTAKKIIEYEGLEYIRNGVVKSINDIIEMDYELYPNYQEITDESIVLPDYYLYFYAESGQVFYISNNQEVAKNEFNFDRIKEYYIKDMENCLIAGIYHTYIFNNNDSNIVNPETEAYDKAKRNLSEQIIFHTENSIYTKKYSNFNIGNEVSEFTLNVKQGVISNNIIGLDDIVTLSFLHGSYFNDKEYVKNESGYVPQENEIYLSLNVYNSMFREKSDIVYYLGENYFSGELLRSPLHINEQIDLEIIENSETKEKLELKNLIIKGILVGGEDEIIVSKELEKKIDDFTMNNSILVKTSSIKNQYSFLKTIYNDYGYFANYYYTERLNSFEDDLSIAQFISNILVPLMIILIVLINTIVISQIVKSKDKENGVLRAIGIKKHSIINIYFLQSIFIICISFIISLAIAIVFINVINNALIGDYSNSISLLLFRYQYAIVIMIVTIVANLVISYISLYKAISKNPIDVIKSKFL